MREHRSMRPDLNLRPLRPELPHSEPQGLLSTRERQPTLLDVRSRRWCCGTSLQYVRMLRGSVTAPINRTVQLGNQLDLANLQCQADRSTSREPSYRCSR